MADTNQRRCQDFEICGLPGIFKYAGGQCYCILHLPEPNKDQDVFWATLKQFVDTNKSDFRCVVFPGVLPFAVGGRSFSDLLNLEDASCADNALDLPNTTLARGIVLRAKKVSTVNLAGAKVLGPVNIEVEESIHEIDFSKATIDGTVRIAAKSVNSLNFQSSVVRSRIYLEIKEKLHKANFQKIRLHGGMRLDCKEIDEFEIQSSKDLFGDFQFRGRGLGRFSAGNAIFNNTITFEFAEIGSLDFNHTELSDLLTARRNNYVGSLNFENATIMKGVDFAHSRRIKMNDKTFDHVVFHELARLNFSGANIEGDLVIDGSPTPPNSIQLNGCTIIGNTNIRSQLGKRLADLVAPEISPDFRGDVVLTNVSLETCRLLGNSIDKITFNNVKWNDESGRSVVYDEKVLEKGEQVVPNLREAYQVLKEKYRQQGDHVTSGDFHYGEMQMKRRGYGRVRRYFGLEAWYYYLSGYGTNPRLAGLWIIFLILMFSHLYSVFGIDTLKDNILEGFLLNMQAATFQPIPFNKYEWPVQLILTFERLVVPLQAALLALAVRMRLKR